MTSRQRIFEAMAFEARVRGLRLVTVAQALEAHARLDGLTPMEAFCFGTSDAMAVAGACHALVAQLA